MPEKKQPTKLRIRTPRYFNTQPMRDITKSRQFARTYLFGSIFILLTTTVFWSYLGARLHLENADQIVNSIMFDKLQSIHNSLLPQAHSFLLKWPLFLLAGILGAKAHTVIALTIIVCLAMVGSFAYLLYRIDKRPYVIGTIYLAIASMLLLVPTVPYDGALLPVSMAMLTTRNIEYMIYIGALISLIRSHGRYRSGWFVVAISLLSVLFASDKLFVSLSIGGALIMMVAFTLVQNYRIARLGLQWFITTAISTLVAIIMLWAIHAVGIANIIQEGSGLGPYGFIKTAKEFVLGSIYALGGILTQFGANPAHDAMALSDVPTRIKEHVFSPALPGLIVNVTFLTIGLYMTLQLMRTTLTVKAPKSKPLLTAPILSVMLIAATIAAIVSFIISKHEYPVDARYLAIAFFAVLVASTTYTKSSTISARKLFGIGILTSAVIIVSIFAATVQFSHNQKPLEQYAERNRAIAQKLADSPVQYLVGDYWRVLPVTLLGSQQAVPSPLADCSQYRTILTRTDWQPNLDNTSFAYLLSFDEGLTDFPKCTEQDVMKHFGEPSSSILIAGTHDHPQELLLFYDRGKTTLEQTERPIALSALPIERLKTPFCANKTIITIVAHQDDDLLFTNPDLQRNIDAGDCVRTIYMTAGDGGMGENYWTSREKGAIAAYSAMAQTSAENWSQKTVKIASNAWVTIASPRNNRNISLIFMRLPDGGLQNEGFADSAFSTLTRLHDGSIDSITTKDGQSTYKNVELKKALITLMNYYKPDEIRTQSTHNSNNLPDHADHIATSLYAQESRDTYVSTATAAKSVAFKTYLGYPVRENEENIFEVDREKKLAAFLAYAQQDSAVCGTIESCLNTPTYGQYLTRQYAQVL